MEEDEAFGWSEDECWLRVREGKKMPASSSQLGRESPRESATVWTILWCKGLVLCDLCYS